MIRRLSSAFSSSNVIFVNRSCSVVLRSVNDIDMDDDGIDDDDDDDSDGTVEDDTAVDSDASLTFNFRTVPIELILVDMIESDIDHKHIVNLTLSTLTTMITMMTIQ